MKAEKLLVLVSFSKFSWIFLTVLQRLTQILKLSFKFKSQSSLAFLTVIMEKTLFSLQKVKKFSSAIRMPNK